MHIQGDSEWLFSLTAQERGLFFSELSHSITVSMRTIAHDGDGSELGFERVRLLNEMQHAVSKYILSIHLGVENLRWIKPMIENALRISDQVVRQQIELSWNHAKSSIVQNEGRIT